MSEITKLLLNAHVDRSLFAIACKILLFIIVAMGCTPLSIINYSQYLKDFQIK
jgi:hypothetical protein